MLLSIETLLGTLFLLFLVWIKVDFTPSSIGKIYFVALALFTIVLLVKIVFDATKVTNVAEHLAKKMAKDIINSSHELFTELYRGSPVPYILTDQEGRILSTNLSALRLLNITEGQYNGKYFLELLVEKEEDHVALFPEKLKHGLPVDDEELQIIRSDGSTRWVMLSLFSYIDLTDRKRKGLLTLVDITKQKQIDKAKSEFVSLASHQLRTPISALRWNTELLATKLKDVLTPDTAKYLEKITNNIHRMDMLVDDFLNVSKFELGTLTPELQNVAIEPFLLNIIEEQSEKVHKKNIRLEKIIDESIPSCISDPNILHMIVSNLVSNAVKYTPEGGHVLIEVMGQNGKLVIKVEDNGMGIPESEQEQVFSKIFRATNAKANVTEGTGLGLYIVQQAVMVLGGTIEFISKEDEGTTFMVILPR